MPSMPSWPAKRWRTLPRARSAARSSGRVSAPQPPNFLIFATPRPFSAPMILGGRTSCGVRPYYERLRMTIAGGPRLLLQRAGRQRLIDDLRQGDALAGHWIAL